MTPQQLRNSILQMAIEGKLVEQRIEEGNSKEFLETILKDVKESNNNGVYDYNKFLNINENDRPFSIPSNWCWVRLGDICSIARGGSPRPIKDYITNDPNGINWIKIGDTNKDDKYINKATEKIKPDGIKKSRFVCPGDFLLTNSMSFGRPYILNIEGCIHDGWLVISQYEKLFDKNFLFWALSSRFAYEQFCKKVSGAVVKNLNIDKVAKSIFPVPPIREQIRIVERIEKIFSLVDLYSEKWEKLEKLNQKFPNDLQKSILQEAIQGKLCEQKDMDGSGHDLIEKILLEKETLIKSGQIKKQKALPPIQDDEIPFDIPKNWAWTRFGELGEYKKGPFGSALTKSIFVPKSEYSIKVYEQKNAIKKDAMLGEYYITNQYYNEKMSAFTVLPGDIIVSCAGTIGETFVMPDNIEKGIINQALMRMRLFKPIFVDYFLMYFDFVLKQSARKNSKGSAIKNIPPFDILKRYLVPLPPLVEQKRIVNKLNKLSAIVERYDKKINKT